MERPKEKKEELDEDLELPPKAVLDEVVDREDGVEEEEDADAGEGACSREMLGKRSFAFLGFDTSSGWISASLSSVPSPRLTSSSESASSGSPDPVGSCSSALPVSGFERSWYWAHRSCTW